MYVMDGGGGVCMRARGALLGPVGVMVILYAIAQYGWICDGEECLRELREQNDNEERGKAKC